MARKFFNPKANVTVELGDEWKDLESEAHLASFDELIKDFIRFSRITFVNATPESSLEKCKEEIKEVENFFASEILQPADKLIEEYIDCIMCLFDSASRIGFTVDEMRAAFARKLNINQKRIWNRNPNNTYSHVKS